MQRKKRLSSVGCMLVTSLAASLVMVAGVKAEPTGFLQVKGAKARSLDVDGRVLYRFHINPFYLKEIEPEARSAGFDRPVPTLHSRGGFDTETSAMRYTSARLSELINGRVEKIISWAGSYVEVYADPAIVSQLLDEKIIIAAEEVERRKNRAVVSQSQPVMTDGDVLSGNEVVPWWKFHTHTNLPWAGNDNRLFTIDGKLRNPISDEINYEFIENVTTDQQNWGTWHATHVHGVIGAKQNNKQIVGINPNQIIHHKGIDGYADQFIASLNSIVGDNHASNRWSVINISMNTDNFFGFTDYTGVGHAMAVASNSNLILQSAGNQNSPDACMYGYNVGGQAVPYDGIMLVGGHDRFGVRSGADVMDAYNLNNELSIEGSNYGPCVEIWAPSHRITSVRFETNLNQILSGTSFASPIAAALAVRYGNNQTRPLEREWYLRQNAVATGQYAAGLPINSVRYPTTPATQLKRHEIANVWSAQGTGNIGVIKDGKYQGDFWNAQGNGGSISIDLGSAKDVKYIRVTPVSSVAPGTDVGINFAVAASTTWPTTSAPSYQHYNFARHLDRAPLTIPIYGMNTRYIVLNGHNLGSWLAYSEIEVYGL